MGEQQGSLKENKREKIEKKEKKKKKKKFFNLTTTIKKYANISRNFSGAVAVSVGSVQFQIAPFSSLHFLISIGPFQSSWCCLQGF